MLFPFQELHFTLLLLLRNALKACHMISLMSTNDGSIRQIRIYSPQQKLSPAHSQQYKEALRDSSSSGKWILAILYIHTHWKFLFFFKENWILHVVGNFQSLLVCEFFFYIQLQFMIKINKMVRNFTFSTLLCYSKSSLGNKIS